MQSHSGSSTGTGVVAVNCLMMRGGTSRAAFFRAEDLPSDAPARDRILMAAMGAGHPLQVDGIGGGNPLTSKVAIVGRSDDPRADIDYLFAQVGVDAGTVDTRANCGNILAAVAPFAIETGLVVARSPTTTVRIRQVNTDTIALATVRTPGGRLRYDGDHLIAGLDNPAAPVRLSFLDQAGAITGRLLPTGRPTDVIGGIAVSVVDYAIPVMIVDARSFGLRGDESPADLDANRTLFRDVEEIRREAGRLMGLGDVSRSVTPKVALVSPPGNGGTLTSRYLMPWQAHKSHAVTGALCLAAATRIDGSVARAVAQPIPGAPAIDIEHPAGTMRLESEDGADGPVMSVVRSARILFRGDVFLPLDPVTPSAVPRAQLLVPAE